MPLRSIEFNFPIYRNGGYETRRLLWEKGNTVETVCLLVLRKPVAYINIDVDVEELDYLIYNDPLAYADLVLNGDPETYLKAVTEYKPLDR